MIKDDTDQDRIPYGANGVFIDAAAPLFSWVRARMGCRPALFFPPSAVLGSILPKIGKKVSISPFQGRLSEFQGRFVGGIFFADHFYCLQCNNLREYRKGSVIFPKIILTDEKRSGECCTIVRFIGRHGLLPLNNCTAVRVVGPAKGRQ